MTGDFALITDTVCLVVRQQAPVHSVVMGCSGAEGDLGNTIDEVSQCVVSILIGIMEKFFICQYSQDSDETIMKIILIYVFSWTGLVILAILNGAIRQKGYGQYSSELTAHQISTFIFVVLIGIYTYWLTRVVALQSSKQALAVGGIWFVMTILFEFVFGHYLMGHSWSKLFHDYNLIQGRVWVVVLIWTFLAPYIIYRIRS